MVIKHNLPAMNAQRQNNIVWRRTAKHTEKLSSGYKINRAADDAAGLSISEKMRRQIRGLSQGASNTQDGVSLCQVADGALNEVIDMVHRLEELSVKAANGTNSKSDREAIQREIDQLLLEIDRISDTTTFNERKLFGGSSAKEDSVFWGSSGSATKPTKPPGGTDPTKPTNPPGKPDPTTPTEPTWSGWKDLRDDNTGFRVIGGIEGKDYKFDKNTGELTILTSEKIVIQNQNSSVATTDRIVVADGVSADVVLAGVNIDVSGQAKAAFEIQNDSRGNVKVKLDGENFLKSGMECAGLQKMSTNPSNDVSGWLTIYGSGSLTAYGGSSGAGIGSNNHGMGTRIRIVEGNVTATGGNNAAGIGGGDSNTGRYIEIEGGNVKAFGKNGGAGIGGGAGGFGIRINITDGRVEATGDDGGAGIGGGSNGFCNYITIVGGMVTAKGGNDAAGIGGGGGADGLVNQITINGGIVKAEAGSGGQSVGSGSSTLATPSTSTVGNIQYKPDKGTVKTSMIAAGALIIEDPPVDIDMSKFKQEGNTITLDGDLTIPDGATLTVAKGFTLELKKKDGVNATLTNAGTVVNNGNMHVYSDDENAYYQVTGGTLSGKLPERKPINQPVTPPDTPPVDPPPVTPTPAPSTTPAISKKPVNELRIQAGQEARQVDGIYLRIGAMNVGVLGLTGLNVVNVHTVVEEVERKVEELDDKGYLVYKTKKVNEVIQEQGAIRALRLLEDALKYVTGLRSDIGAYQNRLEHTIANEENVVENTTAAESRIRDVDVAQEMVASAIANVLGQAGTSMLAQANISNQGVLKLLG